MKKKTHEEFIAQLQDALVKSGDIDKYDLSKMVYVSESYKVIITCKVHDKEMRVRPADWLKKGARCIDCGRESQVLKRKGDFSEYIKKANEIHGSKYDYSKFEYKNYHTPGVVICKEHGEFLKGLGNHISGKRGGCPHCSESKKSENSSIKYGAIFIQKATSLFKGRYSYGKIKYASMDEKVTIICKVHGIFMCTTGAHLYLKSGCPKCSSNVSTEELEVRAYIKSLGVKVIGNIPILNKKHIDIFIPSLNIGVEYCGLYYHNEEHKGISYHLDKFEVAKSKGIKLLQIFSDEWYFNTEAVKTLLKVTILDDRVSSSEYHLTTLSCVTAYKFHLKNGVSLTEINSNSINIGLYLSGNILACISVNSMGSMAIIRGLSSNIPLTHLFPYLMSECILILKSKGVRTIGVVSDNRFSTDSLYSSFGFKLKGNVSPEFYWSRRNRRFPQGDFDVITSEKMIEEGYYRVWNAGGTEWILDI